MHLYPVLCISLAAMLIRGSFWDAEKPTSLWNALVAGALIAIAVIDIIEYAIEKARKP